ncbi:MAG: hypothetical protein C0600_06415 [Ignavibacteria bacterium]|nr:MAG: hypothetical protein C0600_06415 [Ignavibacteria bacterium]
MKMYRSMLICGLLLWATSAMPGCAEDEAVAPVIGECTGDVTVSISVGETVEISWEPECKLFYLLVEPVGSGSDHWAVISDSVNAIAPPVTYGIVPEGAELSRTAEPLEEGKSYDVYLYRWTGPGPHSGVPAGQGVFTR